MAGWAGSGPAPADGGAPTGEHARVGGSGAPQPITGHNIVDADSLVRVHGQVLLALFRWTKDELA